MKNLWKQLFILAFTIYGCSNNTEPVGEPEDETIDHLDYTQMENWAIHPSKTINLLANYNLDIAVVDKDLNIDRVIPITNNSTTNTGVDVFFVHPTVLTQITDPATNIAIEDKNALLITSTVIGQAGLLSKYGRLFAPMYKQSTGPTYSDETTKDLQAEVILKSYNDIKAAFQDYLDNYNNGNKIILAGHSQGSYLLGMLLRDLFDNNQSLRDQLVTAALGGMGYVYAIQNSYQGGWWQNIPLCTTQNECGCIHNWAVFGEDQDIPEPNTGLPEYNQNFVDFGLVYRTVESTDWFVQDQTYYNTTFSPIDLYVAPNQQLNVGGNANFVGFENMYNLRFRRETLQKAVLSIAYTPEVNDLRPNDIADEPNHPNYSNWGYHRKDYNIYTWALMQQIDLKLQSCL